MFDIMKMLEKAGVNVKDLEKDAKRVPALLEILAEHSNKQTGAMKELATKEDIRNLKESVDASLAEIGRKVGRILEKENE